MHSCGQQCLHDGQNMGQMSGFVNHSTQNGQVALFQDARGGRPYSWGKRLGFHWRFIDTIGKIQSSMPLSDHLANNTANHNQGDVRCEILLRTWGSKQNCINDTHISYIYMYIIYCKYIYIILIIFNSIQLETV